MSKQTNGMGAMLFRLILTILLTFTLLGTALCLVGGCLLASPSLLTKQITEQNAPQKAYAALVTKWETQYNATAIPAEVYTSVITESWLEDAMLEQVTVEYKKAHGADMLASTDYQPLADSITAYFEQFAAENNYETDDAYAEKLAESIANAENTVKNAVDVYHIQTMKKAGVWNKLWKMQTLLWIGAAVCLVLSAVWMFLLRKSRPFYWLGTSLFASGVLLTAPTAWILAASMISRFSLKEAAVYAVFTGMMTAIVKIVLIVGILLLAVGLAFWVGSVIRESRNGKRTNES